MTLQNIKIQLRSDVLANWTSLNPILKDNELVIVNDTDNNIERFKIGNGISSFNQLPYVNEQKIITDILDAGQVKAQGITQGSNISASQLAFAAGIFLSAAANFSQTLGINAYAKHNDDYSFVWNGDSTKALGEFYETHGQGTFNINPVNGLSGFYIGDQTLSGILSSTCQPKGNYLSSNALDGYMTYADTKSSLSSDGYTTQVQLDAKSAISVDNQRADVNILHISQEEYNQLVASDAALSNTVYVLSSDYVEAYGQQIKNIASGTDLSDAVNVEQLSNAVSSLDAENVWEACDAVDSAKRKITAATPVIAGSENIVISQGVLATGVACIAGLKGYRYTNTGAVTSSLTFDTAPIGWAAGDVVSIVNDIKYLDCATILSISGTTVTFTENLPFVSIEDDDGWDAKLIYVSEKPDVGDVEIGYGAYAEGLGTKALNAATHSEGFETKALGHYAHAEGRNTIAQYAAHAEGRDTQAIYEESHAEGKATKAKNIAAHAEGARSEATGSASHAEGGDTVASGSRSHAEGESTTASGNNSHAEGNSTTASGNNSHAEGFSTTAFGIYSHAEGLSTNANGEDSHAEGSGTKATSNHSHAEGSGTINVGVGAHSEGVRTKTNGDATHAEGYETWAGNDGTSTNETPVSAPYAHSEGQLTFAKNRAAHAEGLGTNTTTISGRISGAFGIASHSEGVRTLAEGQGAHSEGQETQAIGTQSHAEGKQTQALNQVEHAQGQYNKSNKANSTFGNAGNTLHSIGIGTSNSNRINAVEVMQNGDVYIKGIGNYDGTSISSAQSTQEWINSQISASLTSSDISAAYTNQHIYLSAKGQIVGNIDCSDFIKDGMLSSAELCGTVLVMKFNTDTDSVPISVQLSNFVDNYDEKITGLSAAIDGKVYVDSLSAQSLSVTHIGCDDFYQRVQTSSLLSNEIYVVSCDYVNTYGQQIKNVAPATDLSDAVNLEQLSNAISSIQIPTDLSSFTNSPGYLSSVPDTYALKTDIPNCVFETATVANNTITLESFKTLQYTASANGSLSVLAPSGTSTAVRDIVLVLDLTNATAFTLKWEASKFHPRVAAARDLACDVGKTNVYYINEFKQNHYVVARWVETTAATSGAS